MSNKFHYYKVGLQDVIHIQPTDSDLSTVALKFNFGSSIEKNYEHGLAHMIEHNLFKHNRKHGSSVDISNKFRAIGYTSNAFTSYNITTYYASGLSKFMPEGLGLLSDMLFYPTFLEEDFEKEKNPIMSELKIHTEDTVNLFMAKNHAYLFGEQGYHEILGTSESIQKMKLSDLVKFYQDLYVSANMTIIIKDKRSPEEVVSLIQDLEISNIGEGKVPLKERQKNLKPYPFPTQNKKFRLSNDTAVLMYNLPIHAYVKNMRDHLETVIAENLIGNTLFDIIRDDLGLATYQIDASLSSNTKGSNANQFFSVASPSAIPKIKKEFEKILLDPDFLPKHVTDSFFLNNKLVGEVSVIQGFGLNPTGYFTSKYDPILPQSYEDIMETYLSITKKDVLKRIRKILSQPGIYTELNKKA